MFTFNQTWFIALFGSLEALRRGQAGALMIGMFITNETAISYTMYSNIARLKILAELAIDMIEQLPPQVQWCATPFLDYSNAII